jgi:hypothetical protein
MMTLIGGGADDGRAGPNFYIEGHNHVAPLFSHDRQSRNHGLDLIPAQIPPMAIWARIQGMISSSMDSSGVVASNPRIRLALETSGMRRRTS